MEKSKNEVQKIQTGNNPAVAVRAAMKHYKNTKHCWFKRSAKMQTSLEAWENTFDLVNILSQNFTTYLKLAEWVPPSRYKIYRQKMRQLANQENDPANALKNCEILTPFSAIKNLKIDYGRFNDFFAGNQDLSLAQTTKLEKLFDAAWQEYIQLDDNLDNIYVLMAYAPASRQHLIITEINKFSELDLKTLKRFADHAKLLTPENQKVIQEKWAAASHRFIVATSNPVELSNQSAELATAPHNYRRQAIWLASNEIASQKDDELVWQMLNDIKAPNTLSLAAWLRFYQAAKTKDDVNQLAQRLSLNPIFPSDQAPIPETLMLFAWKEIENAKNLTEAWPLLNKFPTIIAKPEIYEHFCWLYQKQKMEKIQYDGYNQEVRCEQENKKLDKDYLSGHDLLALINQELGKKSLAAKLILYELFPCLQKKIIKGDFSLNQLRQLANEFPGKSLGVVLEEYVKMIKKNHLQNKP